jgi:hypothetical protein
MEVSKMNKQTNKAFTDSELDELLHINASATPPEQFTQQVMASINALPQTIQNRPTWWQWLALTLGGVPAIMQTLAFMFSAWHVAAIG